MQIFSLDFPESWQPYTPPSCFDGLIHFPHPFRRERQWGKTKGLKRHPLINVFKSWHVFFLFAPLNWHTLSMALFTLKWFAIVLPPASLKAYWQMTYQMLPPLSPSILAIPIFFFNKTQSAHPLALPPPGLAVGKPGPSQSQAVMQSMSGSQWWEGKQCINQ